MSSLELNPNLVAVPVGIVVLLLAVWAERIHARRMAAVGRLAFGPTGRPRRWVEGVGPLRAVAAGLLAWGLTVLAVGPIVPLDTTGNEAEEIKEEDLQRVIVLLDVSPSMRIKDAGSTKELERRQRVLEVTDGILSRIALARTRFSLIAFFTSALPVVTDASDVKVVRNMLDNLPLTFAFEPGKTDMIKGLEAAAEMARDWKPKSTTLLICTDGDTVDFSLIPKLPKSIYQVQIYAVGDPVVGTYIDGHDSRQQAGILRRVAAELGGVYYDVNTQHVPSKALTELAVVPPRPPKVGWSLKDFALGAVALGALILVALPILLEYFGSPWRAERELPSLRRDEDDEDESDEPTAVGSRTPQEAAL
jgi:Ca-activated chloride channel family protein